MPLQAKTERLERNTQPASAFSDQAGEAHHIPVTTNAPIRDAARMKGRRRPQRLRVVSDQWPQIGSGTPSTIRGKAVAQAIQMGLSLNSSMKIGCTRKPKGT